MAAAPTIDLNADLGEGVGDDAAILDVVTSANIACGFHAGSPATMRATVRQAVARGIAIGAHVSYRDREGFGRRTVDIAPDRLQADVFEQIATLDAICRSEGARVRYVKPHGALYHRIGYDEAQADAVVEAIAAFRGPIEAGPMALLGMPGSTWLRRAADSGLIPVPEAFADRAYRADGALVPRGEPGAVLSDPGLVAARAVRMLQSGAVEAITGEPVVIAARSLCLHGDSPGAIAMAHAVRGALSAAGVALLPFVDEAP